jgi:uncharacterized membrane protein
MRTVRRCIIALAAAAGLGVLAAGPAAAVDADDFAVDTTRDLYDLCSAGQNDPQADNAQLLCIGYFTGAIDYHQAVVGPEMPPLVCAPEGTTRRNVIDNFVAWAGGRLNDAAVMDAPPINGAVTSAMETWPCTR